MAADDCGESSKNKITESLSLLTSFGRPTVGIGLAI